MYCVACGRDDLGLDAVSPSENQGYAGASPPSRKVDMEVENHQ